MGVPVSSKRSLQGRCNTAWLIFDAPFCSQAGSKRQQLGVTGSTHGNPADACNPSDCKPAAAHSSASAHSTYKHLQAPTKLPLLPLQGACLSAALSCRYCYMVPLQGTESTAGHMHVQRVTLSLWASSQITSSNFLQYTASWLRRKTSYDMISTAAEQRPGGT